MLPQEPTQCISFPRFAFPEREHPPAMFFQSPGLSLISCDGPCPLLRPELRTCRRSHAAIAALMRMPEAAVYEDGRPIFRQNNIRSAWKIPAMQPEPIPECMKSGPDNDFRFCILAAYCGHIPASLLRRVNVGHAPLAASKEV